MMMIVEVLKTVKKIVTTTCLLSFIFTPSVYAHEEPVLRVNIPSTQKKFVFSKEDMNRNFGKQIMTTITPWSQNRALTYRGYSLKDILKYSDLADYRYISVVADNGYSIRILTDNIKDFSPILATEIACEVFDQCGDDGFRILSVQEFGPAFIVWPFEDLPESVDPRDHSKWVWFVTELRPSN